MSTEMKHGPDWETCQHSQCVAERNTDTKAPSALRKEMFIAMRELLGSGYVREYYEENAAPFITIAETHVAELVEALERMVHLYFSGANDPQESPGQYVKQAQDALRRFKEGL